MIPNLGAGLPKRKRRWGHRKRGRRSFVFTAIKSIIKPLNVNICMFNNRVLAKVPHKKKRCGKKGMKKKI